VSGAEALADAGDTRQHFSGHDHRIGDRFELVEAVVTRAAIGAIVGFAEIPDQVPVPAADGCGVALDVAQQRAPGIRELAVALEHDAPLQEIGGRVNQHALGLESVAPGSSRFLLVVLQ
jgi:hypothetical protein